MRDFTWLAAVAALACNPPQRSINDESRGGGESTGGGGTRAGGGAGGTAESGNASAIEPEGGAGSANGGRAGQGCEGCEIGGDCVRAGAVSADNPCEVCAPAVSRSAFTANDGAECDDGSACTDGDQCQGKVCRGEERACELASTSCDERTGKCECAGCAIEQECVASGAKNPQNPCEVCVPTLSGSAYTPSSGESCGATSECEAGVCTPLPNPFDCILPDPPAPELPDDRFVALGSPPPTAKGGPIAAGRYVPVRIDQYGSSAAGLDLRTFEFSKGFVQLATQPWNMEGEVAYIPAIRFAGSFTSDDNVLSFSVERCDPQYDIDVPNLPYTASANGLQIIESLTDGGTRVTSYARQ